MTHTKIERNQLANRHFNRIVKRPHNMAAKLFPIWAITFVTKGRTFVPAGSVSIQILSSQPEAENPKRENIELTCVTGEIEHHVGVAHFSRPRMSHNFARNPQPGARGRVLDPRDSDDPTVKKGDKPNADWVRWALDADKARMAAVDNNYRLPVVPLMPKIVVGVANPELIAFQVTLALKQEIAAHMGRNVEYVESLGEETIATLGRAHWDALFTAPGEKNNDTGLYLIDGRFISNFSRATRIYEDYSELIGCDVWNPARDVAKLGLPRECVLGTADKRLNELVTKLAQATAADADVPADTEGQCPVEAMENELLALLQQVREGLGSLAPLFDDGQLVDFIQHPEQEVLCFGKHDLVTVLGEVAAAELLRSVLGQSRPHLLPYVDNSELVEAAKNLSAPLHIARLPRVQVMRRDLRVPLEDALRFGPEQTGRERLYLNFWPGDWSPRAEHVEAYDAPRSRRNNWRRKQHGASK